MPGINPEKLKAGLERARELLNNPEFVKRSNMKLSADSYEYKDELTESVRDTNQTLKKDAMPISKISPDVIKRSKLPKEILDDMLKNEINVYDGGLTDNILESIAESSKTIKKNATQPTHVTNTTVENMKSNVSVDYSLIKSLIDESVRRHMEELKAVITENSGNALKLVRIAGGNKIQLLDTKGNLFEGKLTLKKNIND